MHLDEEGLHKGSAFVLFSTNSECDQAIEYLHGVVPEGGIHPISVKHSLPSPSPAPPTASSAPRSGDSLLDQTGVDELGGASGYKTTQHVEALVRVDTTRREGLWLPPPPPSPAILYHAGLSSTTLLISLTVAPFPNHCDVTTLCQIFPNLGHIVSAFVKDIVCTNALGYQSLMRIGHIITTGSPSPIAPLSEASIVIDGHVVKVTATVIL